MLGLRSAVRTSNSACWASWADSLPMVRERHPEVADMIVNVLDGEPVTPILSAVTQFLLISSLQVGRPCHMAPAPTVGSTKQLPVLHKCSATRGSRRDFRTVRGQCCAPESGRGAGLSLSAVPSVELSELVPTTSWCCCSAVLASPFLQFPAGVAVHWTLLATIGQRATELECRAPVILLWRVWGTDLSGGRGAGLDEHF